MRNCEEASRIPAIQLNNHDGGRFSSSYVGIDELDDDDGADDYRMRRSQASDPSSSIRPSRCEIHNRGYDSTSLLLSDALSSAPSSNNGGVNDQCLRGPMSVSSMSASAEGRGTFVLPSRYEAIPEDEDVCASRLAFDITSTMGPMSTQDRYFLQELKEKQVCHSPTSDLDQVVKSNWAATYTTPKADTTWNHSSLIRTVTKHISGRFQTRKDTVVRHFQEYGQGQDHHNTKVVSEAPPADISNFEGLYSVWSPDSRRSTFVSEVHKPQTFSPQPNWRPWSMKSPYLLFVISLSVALAVTQEVLFRKFEKEPLSRFRNPTELNPGVYFAVKFAPTLCAVVYGVLWQFIDFDVRRLEAYYQLSKPGGALAAESINVDYLTSFSFLRPFRALRLGHYAVGLSSISATLAISLVPTFASASVVLSPSRQERLMHPDDVKILTMSPLWSRLLTSTLAVCAVCGIGLLILLKSRRTGLLSDVQGIAGLASMAVASHILMDFQGMDTARHGDIHRKLKCHRYMLRNSSLSPDDDNPATSQERGRYEETHLSENPHPLMLRPLGFLPFFIILLAFVVFVPAFLFGPADVITLQAPWLVTATAVYLKMNWNALETAVCMMEPYYIMSKRHAPSKVLTLDYASVPFGYLPLRAIAHGHTVMFLVGFGSVMAEFLTILVTGLATVDGKDFIVDSQGHWGYTSRVNNAGQETLISFGVSFGMVVFILLYMSIVSGLVFLRRRHPFMPRQPNTISSVLAFIHQSKMLYNFAGTAKLSHAERAKKLDDGKTYGLGWYHGRDGQIHCGVDQEELTSSYQHGVDGKKQNQPWNTRWDIL